MLNALVRFALRFRGVIMALAFALVGTRRLSKLLRGMPMLTRV